MPKRGENIYKRKDMIEAGNRWGESPSLREIVRR